MRDVYGGGALRPLEDYLAMFPDHAELIRREYESVRQTRPRSAPEAIGSYRLLEQIGRGAQGVVWRAREERLGLDVALKIMHLHGIFDELHERRFVHEGQLLARIDHPNVCRVLSAGVEDGKPWLAMRLVDGVPLSERVTASDTVTKILRAGAALARGLHAVHAVGVLHRDVKPSNVLVENAGTPVLIDFGLARDTSGDLTALTLTGDRFGTPGYAAPEQCGALAGYDVGVRADIFGLGVLLWEWGTGERAFPSKSMSEYARAVRKPLSDPRRHRRELPAGLHAVLERATAWRPSDRFATCCEFASALEQVEESGRSSLRRLTRAQKVTRWARREPVVAGFSAALVMTLICGLAVSLLLLFEAKRAAEGERRAAYRSAIAGAASALRSGDLGAAAVQLAGCPQPWAWEHAWLTQQVDRSVFRWHLGRAVLCAAPVDAGRYLVATKHELLLVEADHQPRRIAKLGEAPLALAAHPDGRWIALTRSGAGKRALVFGGRERRRIALPGRCHDIAVSKDFETVWLSPAPGQIVRVRGASLERFAIASSVRGAFLRLSPQGQRLAVAGSLDPANAEIAVFDTVQNKLLARQRLTGTRCVGLAFASNARLFVASGWGGVARVCLQSIACASGVVLAAGSVEGELGTSGAIVAEGDACAVALGDGTVVWLDAALESELARSASAGVAKHGFFHDGRTLVTIGARGDVDGLSADYARAVTLLPVGAWSVRSLAFDPSGRVLAVGSARERILIFDLDRGGLPAIRATADSDFVAFDAAGKLHSAGDASWSHVGMDPDVRVRVRGDHVELVRAGRARQLVGVRGKPIALDTCGAGASERVALVTRDGGEARVWLSPNPAAPVMPIPFDGQARAVRFCHSGKAVAIGLEDGTLSLIASDGTGRRAQRIGERGIRQIAWFPDDRRLVVADASGTVWICDPKRERPLFAVGSLPSVPLALAVSPDGQSIACGGNGVPIRLWSLRRRAVVPVMPEVVRAKRASVAAELRFGFTDAALHTASDELRPWVQRYVVTTAGDSSRLIMRQPRRKAGRLLATPFLPQPLYHLFDPLLAVGEAWRLPRVLAALRCGDPVLPDGSKSGPLETWIRWLIAVRGRVTPTIMPSGPLAVWFREEIAVFREGGSRRDAWLALERAGGEVDAVAPRLREAARLLARTSAPSRRDVRRWALLVARSPVRSPATYAAAMTLVERYLIAPLTAQERVARAACLLRTGKHEAAWGELRELEQSGVALDAHGHYFMALVARQLGNEAEDEKHCEQLRVLARRATGAPEPKRIAELFLTTLLARD